jgi:hypothetical protein
VEKTPISAGNVADFEVLRAYYRPERVRVLFVGESLPAGGTFFFNGDSNLARYTCKAFAKALGTPDDVRSFPSVFRDQGCYLIDLCAVPVNHLSGPEKKAARVAGIPALACELHKHRPVAVVVVMKAIEKHVVRALVQAGMSHVPVSVLPFPAFRWQQKYVHDLSALLPSFPVENRARRPAPPHAAEAQRPIPRD